MIILKQKQADMLEGDLELKEKEVYDLKHELIVSDSKAETATKELDEALEKLRISKKRLLNFRQNLKSKLNDQASAWSFLTNKTVIGEIYVS